VFEDNVNRVIGRTLKLRKVYLFNDMLLVLKSKKKKKSNRFDIFDFKILLKDITNVTSTEEDRYQFKIEVSDEEIYLFHTENKVSWINIIKSTIKKLNSIPGALEEMRVEEQSGEEDFFLFHDDLSKESLMSMIIKWSLLKDTDQIMREIKGVAKSIEHVRRLVSEETL